MLDKSTARVGLCVNLAFLFFVFVFFCLPCYGTLLYTLLLRSASPEAGGKVFCLSRSRGLGFPFWTTAETNAPLYPPYLHANQEPNWSRAFGRDSGRALVLLTSAGLEPGVGKGHRSWPFARDSSSRSHTLESRAQEASHHGTEVASH